MGQVRKINDVYYIEFYARGLLYSQVAGSSLPEAERLLKEIEEKIAGGEALTIVRHIELADFFERFLVQAKAPYGPKTLERLGSTIRHFSGFLQKEFPKIHQLAQLTPSVVESYKASLVRAHAPKTVNLTLLLLRDILEFGIKLGFLNDNPTLHVRLLPWPPARPRKATVRFQTAKQVLAQGTGLCKLAQLLKWTDVSRGLFYANLIPLSREDTV